MDSEQTDRHRTIAYTRAIAVRRAAKILHSLTKTDIKTNRDQMTTINRA